MPGSARTSRPSAARARRRSPVRGAGGPISTYVVPRSRATRAATSASRRRPRRYRAPSSSQPPQRLELLALGGNGSRAEDASEHVESAPSRCAERHARRTTRCEEGCGVTSARSRSPTACGPLCHQPVLARRQRRTQPLRLDILGHLAQRDLAQRLEVLDAEEAVQRGRHARGRVDLPARRRSISAGGVTSMSTTSSAPLTGRVGQRLAHRTRSAPATWSLSDSRCCTLTVE